MSLSSLMSKDRKVRTTATQKEAVAMDFSKRRDGRVIGTWDYTPPSAI